MIPDTATDTKANFLRLLSYVKERKIGLIMAIIGMIGYGAVDTMFVYSIKPLIDEGLTGKNPQVLTYMPIFVLGIVLLRGSAVLPVVMAWLGLVVIW